MNVQEGRGKHTYSEEINVRYKLQPNGTFRDFWKISIIKTTPEGTDNISDIAEEKTSKLEKIEIGITQNKSQSKNRLKIK